MNEEQKFWLVETNKQSLLEKKKFLVDDISISDIIHRFCWKDTEFDPEHDYILIKPSDVVYYRRYKADV